MGPPDGIGDKSIAGSGHPQVWIVAVPGDRPRNVGKCIGFCTTEYSDIKVISVSAEAGDSKYFAHYKTSAHSFGVAGVRGRNR